MCGAVKLAARGVSEQASACHCDMCRRWSSGPFLAVMVQALDVVEGEAATVGSSAWAERGFCPQCGSSLFYRITADGPHHGVTTVAYGALDDPSGIQVTTEWFHDRKPDGYALAGDTKQITEAQAMAMFAGDG